MDVVRCPGCGEENPSRFRLCGYCGTSLTLPVVASVSCPACGSENPAGFRFCGFCGTVLDPQAAGPGGPPGDPMHGGHPGAPGYGLPPWAWWAVRWAPPWSPPGAYGTPTPPGWPAPPAGWGTPPPGWGPPPPGWGPPPPGWGQPAPPQAGYAQAGYPPVGYPPPGWAAPVAQPGSPPPGWATPTPGWGQPGWGTPPVGSPPAGWAPPAAQPPPLQPSTPPPFVPTDPVAEPPMVALPLPPLPPSPPPVAAPTTPGDPETTPADPGLAPAPAPPPAQPPSLSSVEGPSPAAPQAAPPQPSDAGRPASATPAAFPGFEGVAAPAALPSQEIRKVVTIIFSDLKGSTALTEKIDAEAINEVKERYFTSMAAAITQHGGKIEKYIGDAIMAVFGLPRAHEDDALRAVRAAHGMTQAMHRLNVDLLKLYGVEIAARTGVNTGEVVANTDEAAEQRLATGDAVNVAARLEQAAPANEVLIGEVTYDLVRAHVDVEAVEPLELKGKAERVPAYRLIDVRGKARMERSPASRAQLVGREEQLEQLRAELRDVVGHGGARLAAVLGEAGVGKTFLLETFQEEIRKSTTVLQGRCLPYGDGITFWPLVEIARAAAGIVDDDTPEVALTKLGSVLEGVASGTEIRDRVGSVIGLTTDRFPVGEIFWGTRRFLEALGSRRPVVVCIEDVHNAEATFLDLLEHVLDSTGPQSAVLIIATGRLGLLDKRPQWVAHAGVQAVTVEALDALQTERLVEVLLGGTVDDAINARVVATSEGNPLFASQLVSMLVDKGLIRYDESTWLPEGDLAAAAVPPTIQALLAERLDDLSREERAVMEPASVIGLSFAQAAIEDLVPVSLRPSVPNHLSSLDRKQFVAHAASDESDDVLYRFRNLMIKDATYGSLLKRARAQLHERFVTWAERVNRERGREQEFEEILGYHLEQAFRYRTELGPVDAEGRAIAERAASKLSNAGRRAMARGDIPACVSLLTRAAALLPTSSVGRLDILFDLGEALVLHGQLDEARTLVEEGTRLAIELDDGRLVARMAINELTLEQYAGTGSAAHQIDRAKEIIQTLQRYEDDVALARAWNEVVVRELTLGRYDSGAESADKLVDYAKRSGDQRLTAHAAPTLAYLMVHGQTPVPDGIRECEEVLLTIVGHQKTEAIVRAALAQLKAMNGEFDEARSLCLRVKEILVELGARLDANSTSIEASRVEILAGDLVAAETLLRRDDAALQAIDERYFRSTIAAILANVLALRGALDEADDYARLAEELADEDDLWSQVSWRTARAKVLAHRGGSLDDAIAMAQGAVDLATDSGDIEMRADALTELGRVYTIAGRRESAGPPWREALELYEVKADLAASRLVSELLADPTPA